MFWHCAERNRFRSSRDSVPTKAVPPPKCVRSPVSVHIFTAFKVRGSPVVSLWKFFEFPARRRNKKAAAQVHRGQSNTRARRDPPPTIERYRVSSRSVPVYLSRVRRFDVQDLPPPPHVRTRHRNELADPTVLLGKTKKRTPEKWRVSDVPLSSDKSEIGCGERGLNGNARCFGAAVSDVIASTGRQMRRTRRVRLATTNEKWGGNQCIESNILQPKIKISKMFFR